jgi:hypothetical protein
MLARSLLSWLLINLQNFSEKKKKSSKDKDNHQNTKTPSDNGNPSVAGPETAGTDGSTRPSDEL